MQFDRPELSIVTPVLNERDELPAFLDMLERQERLRFELVISDGGSKDGSLEWLEEQRAGQGFKVRLRRGDRGRARQLNLGARAARGEILLFLHVDSRLDDPLALRTSLDFFEQQQIQSPSGEVAGRFPLRFLRGTRGSETSFFFYEQKTRLDRPGCTHGDQGFLMAREFFFRIGPFDETLAVLEDTRLAERIRRQGSWVLLPGELRTSARRFETEGLAARQLLNAFIMNFSHIGWEAFFASAPGVYRAQSRTRRMELLPWFDLIAGLLRQEPPGRRKQLWRATGSYVRDNLWQLFFALDARRSFRRSAALEQRRLRFFDRRLAPRLAGQRSAALCAYLTRLLFRGGHLLLKLRRALLSRIK